MSNLWALIAANQDQLTKARTAFVLALSQVSGCGRAEFDRAEQLRARLKALTEYVARLKHQTESEGR